MYSVYVLGPSPGDKGVKVTLPSAGPLPAVTVAKLPVPLNVAPEKAVGFNAPGVRVSTEKVVTEPPRAVIPVVKSVEFAVGSLT
jgi:hypothetical protein